MMHIGNIISWLLIGIAVLLSVPAASHTGLTTWVSLAAASAAFVAMAQNLILATRLKFLESTFGGLDQVYAHHRLLGITALLLVLTHYFLEPNFKGIILTSGLNIAARQIGEIAFFALIFLLAISLIKRLPFTNLELPYNIWRQSHRLMGVIFCLLAFHQMFIKRPFDGTALLAQYLLVFAILGIAAFVYTQASPFLRKRPYRIKNLERTKDALLITASAIGKPIRHRPGQFAFIGFNRSGLREPHPFTIAGSRDNEELRFAIKSSGDFTSSAYQKLEIGDELKVEGGYGRFCFNPKQERQIWLAGGIGITPFLAMSDSISTHNNVEIALIHTVTDRAQALDTDRLSAFSDQYSNFHFLLHETKESGRLDFAKLAAMAPFDLNGSALSFCGPVKLRKTIERGMAKQGKRFSRVNFEKFEFR